MKYLNGNYYVEAKDHRDKIHPTEKIILRKRDPPTSLRTQYQVQNDIQIRKNQKVIKNDNDELIVKNYPKKKQPTQKKQPIYKPPNCPRRRRIYGWNLIKDGIVKIVNILLINRNITLTNRFEDKIVIFLQDYLMLIKRLEGYMFLWPILI